MSKEYIEREALINTVCAQYQGGMNTFWAKPNDFVRMVEDEPTVAVEPKQGRWEKVNLFVAIFGLAKCSVCGNWGERTRYCPNCGSKMYGESEDVQA